MPDPLEPPIITEKMMIATQWNLLVERSKFLSTVRSTLSLISLLLLIASPALLFIVYRLAFTR